MPYTIPHAYLDLALRSYAQQAYQQLELVAVVSKDSRWDVSEYAASMLNLRLIHVPPGLSIGELRNVGNREARGSIIAHWDSDDWSAPDRLALQVERLLALNEGWPGAISASQLYYQDPASKMAWLYNARSAGWVSGGGMAYWRRTWERHPFQVALEYGEDTAWLPVKSGAVYVPFGYVATIHAGNTSPKHPVGPEWTPMDCAEVERVMGAR